MRQNLYRGALAAGLALGLVIGLALPARAQDNQVKPVVPPNPADLQKQVDDAIKLLDKLDPKETDEVKKRLDDLRKQLQVPLGGLGGFGGIGGLPGGIPGIQPGNLQGVFQIVGNGGFGGGFPMPNGRLGATFRPVEKVLELQLQLKPNQGQVVTDVQANSAAAKAGIKQHDILLELDGKTIASDPAAFHRSIADAKADVEMNATVLREGKRETIKGLKLAEADPNAPFGNNPFGGAFPGGIQILPGNAFPLPGNVPGNPGGIQIPPIQVPPIQLPNGQVVPVPPIQVPNIQLPPGAVPPGIVPPNGGVQIQGVVNAGAGEATAVSITNDSFTINHTAGNLKIEIKGTRDDGKSIASNITIEDGKATVRAQGIEQVPAMYLPTVNRLLESVK